MAEGQQIGQVLLRLLVDNKAFAEGLKNSIELVAIASRQIKDLTEFKIDAPDFSELDIAVEASQKKIGELLAEQKVSADVQVDLGGAFGEAGEKIEGQTRKVSEGENALRKFRSEQRTSNFIVRESTQVIQGLTAAVGFFALGNQDAEGTTKRVSNSLLAGVSSANALEFALFGVGRAGERMGGSLGLSLTKIAGMAGPISLVIGLGVSLVSFLNSANEKAEKLAEKGLDALLNRLREFSGQSPALFQAVTKSIEGQRKALEDLQRVASTASFGAPPVAQKLPPGFIDQTARAPREALFQQTVAAGDVTRSQAAAATVQQLESEDKQRTEILEKLKEQIKEQEVLNEFLGKANDFIRENGTEQDKLKLRIEDLNKEIQSGLGTDEERRKKIDQKIELENQLRDSLRSTLQVEQERLTKAEMQRVLGLVTVDAVVQQYQQMLKLNLTEQQRLEIQVKIKAVLDEQFEVERQRESERLEASAKFRTDQETLQEITRRNAASGVQDEFERKRAAARAQFETDKKQIEELGALQGVTIDGTKILTLDAQKAMAEADKKLKRELNDIDTAQINDVLNKRLEAADRRFQVEQLLLGEGHAAELAFIQAEFDDAQRIATDLYVADLARISGKKEEEIKAILERAETELEVQEILAGDDQAKLAQIAGARARLESTMRALGIARSNAVTNAEFANMQRAFATAQSLIGNIVGIAAHLSPEAQRFVEGLQRALSVAQSIVAVIQTINTLSNIFGFGTGGFTGVGQKNEVAGVVHKEEFVFEADITKQNLPELMKLRRAMQSGVKLEDIIPGFQGGGFAGLPPPVDLERTLGQVATFIIQNDPAFRGGVTIEKFDALIDEMRSVGEKVDRVTAETRDLADRINIKIPETITVEAEGRSLKKVIRRDDASNQ